ncbi:MAG: hypothetical protein IIX91_03760, partial [Clostridia bacterium]|nr:hypothetical protein [Clostridia bacterium]
MKTQKSLFFKTALCLLVACAVLSSGMLFIAASVEGTSSIDGESVTPAIEDVGGSDADLPPVDDPETPAPPATVVDRYLTVTEEEGKTVATLYTPEQIADFNARREAGEWFNLSDEEVLALITDTREMFFEYDVIRINNLDGTTSKYYGYSFYSEGDYLQYFGMPVEETDATFCMSEDMHNAIIERVSVIHSAVAIAPENHHPRWVTIFTGLEEAPDQEPLISAQGELTMLGLSIYGYWFFENDYWSGIYDNSFSGGAFVLIPNGIGRQTAHYISDIGNSDKNDLTLLYNAADDFNFGKFEYATEGHSMVIELWDDKTESLVARIRVDDAEEVATAEGLWDEMMAYIDGNPDYEMVDVEDYFTVNNHSVVVYLNGAKGLYGDGPTYSHYRADYKSDI